VVLLDDQWAAYDASVWNFDERPNQLDLKLVSVAILMIGNMLSVLVGCASVPFSSLMPQLSVTLIVLLVVLVMPLLFVFGVMIPIPFHAFGIFPANWVISRSGLMIFRNFHPSSPS
jgi:hypothetical protein